MLPPGTVAFERIGTDVVVAIVTRALPPHSRLDGGASRAEKHAHGGLLRVVGDGDGDGADGDGDGDADTDADTNVTFRCVSSKLNSITVRI